MHLPTGVSEIVERRFYENVDETVHIEYFIFSGFRHEQPFILSFRYQGYRVIQNLSSYF